MADIRLIDANAMRNDWLENGENEYVYDTNAVLDSIDAQPTIDPESLRPVGRWHLNEDGKWACTYCDGLAVEHPDEPDKWQALTRYCPHCGARTKGENDG